MESRNDFVKRLQVKTSLKKTRNIYALQQQVHKNMKVLITPEEI